MTLQEAKSKLQNIKTDVSILADALTLKHMYSEHIHCHEDLWEAERYIDSAIADINDLIAKEALDTKARS